jgi:outer membrane lipoprotein
MMISKKNSYFFGIIFIVFVAACTKGISKQARSQVTYTGDFSELQRNPDDHQDEVVLLGGKIIDTKANANSSEIVVLKLPLGGSDRPQVGDQSKGRFLIRSKQLLDPALYRKGMAITVVGRLVGNETRAIDEFKYNYPLIEPMEVKLWSENRYGGPSVHFGFGVLKSF